MLHQLPIVPPCQFKKIIKNQIKIYTREISLGKLIGSKITKIHLFSLTSSKIPEVADQRGCHSLRGWGCQYGSSFSLSNVLFLSYTFQTFHFRAIMLCLFFPNFSIIDDLSYLCFSAFK